MKKNYLNEDYETENRVLSIINDNRFIYKDQLHYDFNPKELKVIKKLIEEEYLICFEDRGVMLSSKGVGRLYKLTYSKKIGDFFDLLLLYDFDASLLDDYLDSQDINLRLPIDEVLNITSYQSYCNSFVRRR